MRLGTLNLRVNILCSRDSIFYKIYSDDHDHRERKLRAWDFTHHSTGSYHTISAGARDLDLREAFWAGWWAGYHDIFTSIPFLVSLALLLALAFSRVGFSSGLVHEAEQKMFSVRASGDIHRLSSPRLPSSV